MSRPLTANRRKYLSFRVSEARRKLKVRAIEYKGGKCQKCGYCKCKAALQFHHLNPDEKDFGFSGKNITWEKAKLELDKTILICSNCHFEIHEEETKENAVLLEKEVRGLTSDRIRASHGSPGRYFSGCRCIECKTSHNLRIREYRRKVKRNKRVAV